MYVSRNQCFSVRTISRTVANNRHVAYSLPLCAINMIVFPFEHNVKTQHQSLCSIHLPPLSV